MNSNGLFVNGDDIIYTDLTREEFAAALWDIGHGEEDGIDST